jgi:hypothetical protein
MSIDGHRFVLERHKLCVWLESEKRKLGTLPEEHKVRRELELEREFRSRLDRLYGEIRPALRRERLN